MRPGKSCATVESGKWVGPAKSQVGGEVVEINDTVVSKPDTCNEDPYDAGWLVVVKPQNWDEVKPNLIAGTDVSDPYERKWMPMVLPAALDQTKNRNSYGSWPGC